MLTQDQFRIVIDVNYDTRVQLGHTGTLSTELYALGVALKALKLWASTNNATEILVWKQKWATKANISELLGAMAASPMGRYYENRPAIDALSSWLGVPVREGMVLTPSPAPAPVVEPLPPPTTEPAPAPAPVPIPSGDIVAIVKALAEQYNLHITPGKIGIGMKPKPESQGALFIGDTVAAEIVGVSNTRKTDGQNPDHPHANRVILCDNDGGVGMQQYGEWGAAGAIRNTPNRDMTIARFDSMGEPCISKAPPGSVSDGGQLVYLRIDFNRLRVWLQSFKPGWSIGLLRSSRYGAADVDVIDEKIEAAFRARGL